MHCDAPPEARDLYSGGKWQRNHLRGGSLGSFRPGEMVAEFDAYCFDPATEIGTVGVVGTEFGTHLIQVAERSEKAE